MDGAGNQIPGGIAVGVDDLPVLSYLTDGRLRVAHCGNASCSAGNTLTTLDAVHPAGGRPAIAIGADGLPVVAYHYSLGGLLVAKCAHRTCAP